MSEREGRRRIDGYWMEGEMNDVWKAGCLAEWMNGWVVNG